MLKLNYFIRSRDFWERGVNSKSILYIFCLYFLLACGQSSINNIVKVNVSIFPQKIVVDVTPYQNVKTALADEENIDWDIEKTKAKAITLA